MSLALLWLYTCLVTNSIDVTFINSFYYSSSLYSLFHLGLVWVSVCAFALFQNRIFTEGRISWVWSKALFSSPRPQIGTVHKPACVFGLIFTTKPLQLAIAKPWRRSWYIAYTRKYSFLAKRSYIFSLYVIYRITL